MGKMSTISFNFLAKYISLHETAARIVAQTCFRSSIIDYRTKFFFTWCLSIHKRHKQSDIRHFNIILLTRSIVWLIKQKSNVDFLSIPQFSAFTIHQELFGMSSFTPEDDTNKDIDRGVEVASSKNFVCKLTKSTTEDDKGGGQSIIDNRFPQAISKSENEYATGTWIFDDY